MTLPFNLDEFINGRTIEWERLEFKAGWNPEAVLHTACAFANDISNLEAGNEGQRFTRASVRN